MKNYIINYLRAFNLEDKTIIVGFSGGYDSMCLLDILSKIKDDSRFPDLRIIAAHFNHNWRGEEALKEQEVCKLFAQSRGIEFYTKTASDKIKKTENDARIARYDFFEEVYDIYDADAVFTAHNKDDNAETILYRVIKGTGLIGLKGIANHRDYFYRPLLKITRQEILQYCNENNLVPNNDSSNQDIKYKRNLIRLNIIPEIEQINPNAKDAINSLAEVAKNEDNIIEEYISKYRDKVFINDRINPVEYKKLSKNVKLRFIYEFVQKIGIDYDYRKILEIYTFIEMNINQKNGTTKSLATALWLYVDEKIIETIPRKSELSIDLKPKVKISVNGEGEYKIDHDKILSIKPYNEDKVFVFPEATSTFAYVDFSDITFPITLRTREDGDTITPFGMEGSMKLKKYLNSRGIPRHDRDNMYLLADNKDVLWAVGAGISNRIKVITKPTHVIELR